MLKRRAATINQYSYYNLDIIYYLSIINYFFNEFEPSSSDDFIVNNVAARSAFSILQVTGMDG